MTIQPFIKQFFFEFTTNATLGWRVNGIVGSLEKEARVVRVIASKVGFRAREVAVGADVVVKTGIAKIGAGIVKVGVGTVRVDVGEVGVREAGIEEVGVGKAGIGEAGMGEVGIGEAGVRGAGVVLVETGVISSGTESRSRLVQIFLAKLR